MRLFVLEGTSWVELTTTVIDGSADPVQFKAVTTHFSKFVAAKKVTSSGGGGGGGGAAVIKTPLPAPVNPTANTPKPTQSIESTPAQTGETGTSVGTPSTGTGQEGVPGITGAAVTGQGIKNIPMAVAVTLFVLILGLGFVSYMRTGRLFRFKKE